ncbi:MAG: hypothetical protein R3C56_25765 [Pirellulaceae bacterium]
MLSRYGGSDSTEQEIGPDADQASENASNEPVTGETIIDEAKTDEAVMNDQHRWSQLKALTMAIPA